MRRRRIVLLIVASVAIALFAFWIWDATTPIPLIEINWVAPKAIEDTASYDTDGDGYGDVLVVKANQWWQLRIVDGQWQEEPLPVPANYTLVGLTFLNSPVLLFRDPQDLIWVMQYRDGWILRPSKVKSPDLYGSCSLYDFDGDGLKDDLVVKESKTSVDRFKWFKLQTDGSLVLKDELSLPPYTYSDICAWRGKLRVAKRSGQLVKIPDIDGDSVMEWMVIFESGASYGETELELMASQGSKTQRLKVSLEHLDTSMPRRFTKVVDINGDGWQEVVLVGWRNQRPFLLLLHYDGTNWRSETVPFQLVDDYPDIFTMQVGRSKRLILFSAYENECQMIWHDGNRWREQRWRFKGHPTLIWEEKGTWRMLIARSIWLSEYQFWRVFWEWCFKLRNWKLPVPIPPSTIDLAEVWKWNEKEFGWRREGSFALGGFPDLNYGDRELDLNNDGYKEVLVIEEHSLTFATLAVRVGRWQKRWKSVHLWVNDPYLHSILELSDGKRIWLVSVKGSNLRAWTLK